MHVRTRRAAEGLAATGGLAAIGGIVLFRPGTKAYRVARHQLDEAAHRLRYAGGRLQGVSYRLRGRQPDPEASGILLADRVRSTLGPLEKRLDLPRIHVMAEDHVVLLHGEVGAPSDIDEIESAVAAVSGVRGVESYLHIGFTQGETRPSAGRAAREPSDAFRRLVAAAHAAGVSDDAAPAVVRGVLAAIAERIPEGERGQVAAHLPDDVRVLFTPPHRLHHLAPARTVAQLVGRITATTEAMPPEAAVSITREVIGELRSLVPDEEADVAAVLPTELRELWEKA